MRKNVSSAFRKLKTWGTGGIIAMGTFFLCTSANATMTVSGQGYYSSWCGTYLSTCQSQATVNPNTLAQAGVITADEAVGMISANNAVCGSAYSKCMSTPVHTTSSPSGYIFRFDAYMPY